MEHIGATEDEAACRAARPGGTRLHFDSSSKPGATVLRDREALVRVARTCGEGIIQAPGLDNPPRTERTVRVGPPGKEETEPTPDGERPWEPGEMQRPRKTMDPGSGHSLTLRATLRFRATLRLRAALRAAPHSPYGEFEIR